MVKQIYLRWIWPPDRNITFGREQPVSLRLLCYCGIYVQCVAVLAFWAWKGFVSFLVWHMVDKFLICDIIIPVLQKSLNKSQATLGTDTEWIHRSRLSLIWKWGLHSWWDIKFKFFQESSSMYTGIPGLNFFKENFFRGSLVANLPRFSWTYSCFSSLVLSPLFYLVSIPSLLQPVFVAMKTSCSCILALF